MHSKYNKIHISFANPTKHQIPNPITHTVKRKENYYLYYIHKKSLILVDNLIKKKLKVKNN